MCVCMNYPFPSSLLMNQQQSFRMIIPRSFSTPCPHNFFFFLVINTHREDKAGNKKNSERERERKFVCGACGFSTTESPDRTVVGAVFYRHGMGEGGDSIAVASDKSSIVCVLSPLLSFVMIRHAVHGDSHFRRTCNPATFRLSDFSVSVLSAILEQQQQQQQQKRNKIK